VASPCLARFAQCVDDGNELSCDGDDNDLVGFSFCAEAICEAFENGIVVAGNEGSLEHHVPQQASSAADGAFAAHDPAIRGSNPRSRRRMTKSAKDI